MPDCANDVTRYQVTSFSRTYDTSATQAEHIEGPLRDETHELEIVPDGYQTSPLSTTNGCSPPPHVVIGRGHRSFVPAQSDYEEEEDQDNNAGQYALDQEELDELQRDKENITKEVRSCGIPAIPRPPRSRVSVCHFPLHTTIKPRIILP